MKHIIGDISKPVSIRQVAELSGVSVSTVSKAFNGYTQVGKGTVKKVFLAAEKLGYKPDSRARSLRSGKHWNIGVLRSIPYVDSFFSETMLSHLVYGITAEGYGVSFEHLSIGEGNKLIRPDLISTNKVDGIVIIGHLDSEYLEQVSEWGLAVCLLDNSFEHTNFCSVSSDHASGNREAVQYLAALGHERIGYIHGTLDWPATRARYDGYVETIRELNLRFDPGYIVKVEGQQQNYRGAYRATLKLLSQSPDITAILYVNDWYAIGGLAAIGSLGKKVPEDINVIGFDNSWMSQDTDPALTTVSCEPELFCHTAALNLVRKVENKPINSNMVIRSLLVKRDSCAVLRENSK